MYALETQWLSEADNYPREKYPGELVNRYFACASFNAAECEAYAHNNPTSRERFRQVTQLPVIDHASDGRAATWHLIEAKSAQECDRNDTGGPYCYYIAHLPPGHDWLRNVDDRYCRIIATFGGCQKLLNVGYPFIPGTNCGIHGLINGTVMP